MIQFRKAILSLVFIPFCWTLAQQKGINQYNILNFGAVNDSTVLSTQAINEAIRACTEHGGGRVVFPAGKYQSGTIFLKSNVELYLEAGAILYGSKNPDDYPSQPRVKYRSLKDGLGWYSLIYAADQRNIAISGLGTIDGRGKGRKGVNNGFGGDQNGRPRNILFITCKNVTVTGIEMRNAAMWNQHYLDCEDLIVDKIRVYNHCNGNNDGIDIDGCRRVTLSNSIIDSDDDGIVLKSTGTAPCEDIAITNCVVSSQANAIKCGTESTAGFKNIAISNCVVKPTRSTEQPIVKIAKHGINGISLEVVDGGVMDGVTINNMMIHGTECPLYVRLANRARKHITEAPEPPMGQMRNIFISNITAYETGNYCSSITGVPAGKIENIHLDNIHFYNKGGLVKGHFRDISKESTKSHDVVSAGDTDEYMATYSNVVEDEKGYPQPTVWRNLPSYGLFIRHVKDIYVTNSDFKSQASEPRVPIIAVDVESLVMKNVGATKTGNQPQVLLNSVSKSQIDKDLTVRKN
jgi:polygalacturonase